MEERQAIVRVCALVLVCALSSACALLGGPVESIVSYTNEVGTATAIATDESITVWIPLDSLEVNPPSTGVICELRFTMESKGWVISVMKGDLGRHGATLWSFSAGQRTPTLGARDENSRDITVRTDNGLTITIGPMWARRIRENGVKKFRMSTRHASGDVRIDYVSTDLGNARLKLPDATLTVDGAPPDLQPIIASTEDAFRRGDAVAFARLIHPELGKDILLEYFFKDLRDGRTVSFNAPVGRWMTRFAPSRCVEPVYVDYHRAGTSEFPAFTWGSILVWFDRYPGDERWYAVGLALDYWSI